tara:strand:+ start:66 stop:1262 length:1197 start_codon:yes stop_codon:yes gene_type:complete
MKLSSGSHLAYCTNVHRGNNWPETFDSLERYVLKVREKVCPDDSFAIGLRLGAEAARELADPKELLSFQRWLERMDCYVFTINGFPYGSFHGTRVKEEVYRPDWTSTERLDYTLLLFDLLEKLLPRGAEGSVSTLPGSFKEFIANQSTPKVLFQNLIACATRMEKIARAKSLDLHLGLEPEPLGLFETIPETLDFFDALREESKGMEELTPRIGVNYDCCHLAIEREDASVGLSALLDAGIRVSKLHLSSALSLEPTERNLRQLEDYVEEVYLHQVITSKEGKVIERIKDLDVALEKAKDPNFSKGDEWRVHFHVPLHASPGEGLRDTRSHVLATLDWLSEHPKACAHLEMETYTWEVLPAKLRSDSVIEQVAREYQWTLEALGERGLDNRQRPEPKK